MDSTWSINIVLNAEDRFVLTLTMQTLYVLGYWWKILLSNKPNWVMFCVYLCVDGTSHEIIVIRNHYQSLGGNLTLPKSWM